MRNGSAEERVHLDPRSPLWGEHRSRYHFASSHVSGRRVLDIACGAGFGTQILADAGAAVIVGMDITLDLDAQARADTRIRWCRADGTRLPLVSASIDTIISFETIEHVDRDETFLSELRRVSADHGVIILSTPNGLRSPKKPDGTPLNPFHVREYTPDQLWALLRKHFVSVEIMGQRTKSHYKVSPYWEGPRAPGSDLIGRLRVFAWRLANLLPLNIKDPLSRLLFKRPFFPGESDFDFLGDNLETGHVIVALCRP